MRIVLWLVRAGLLAAGFLTGFVLHEPRGSENWPIVRLDLAGVRHAQQATFCDRVRVDVRVVNNSDRTGPAVEPVLVCDCSPGNSIQEPTLEVSNQGTSRLIADRLHHQTPDCLNGL